jgi:hypothetical protein
VESSGKQSKSKEKQWKAIKKLWDAVESGPKLKGCNTKQWKSSGKQ